jgi:hypothetical protein
MELSPSCSSIFDIYCILNNTLLYSRHYAPEPVAGNDAPAVARQFVGEGLRVTGAAHLVARRSAPVDLLTSWVATASRLLISRRSPSMVTTTLSLSASTGSAGRFFGRGPPIDIKPLRAKATATRAGPVGA